MHWTWPIGAACAKSRDTSDDLPPASTSYRVVISTSSFDFKRPELRADTAARRMRTVEPFDTKLDK